MQKLIAAASADVFSCAVQAPAYRRQLRKRGRYQLRGTIVTKKGSTRLLTFEISTSS